MIASVLSFGLIWYYGPTLLKWQYGQNVGSRIMGWRTVRWIGEYYVGFRWSLVLVGLAVFARFYVGRGTLALPARCFMWAGLVWAIGWYLAIYHGHILFPLR